MRLTKIIVASFFALSICLCGCKQNGKPLQRGAASPQLDSAFNAYIAAVESENEDIHSIMILQHGKVLKELWREGAAPDSAHVMWSVSKTFTSVAVGFAISEGLINVDDTVISFFPESLPDSVSENLAAATVKDLLTMNFGHEKEPEDLGQDWVKGFLAAPVPQKPGTWFCYNSRGTFMLSAIVQKLTGQKIVDYLDSRLWQPLGIEKPQWDENPQGINIGGWGLHLKTEDMAKLGQTLLDGGKYYGKQVIPADWVEQMTSYKVPSMPAGVRPDQVEQFGLTAEGNDWMNGYCYQMWRCRHNAYRADGAFGQFIIVMPDEDAVVAITAKVDNMFAELDKVWKYLLPALQQG